MSDLSYAGKIVFSPVTIKKNKLTNFIASVSEAVRGIFLPPPKLRPQKNITMFTNRKRVYTTGTNAVSRSTTDRLIISVRQKESVKAAASARLFLISILTNWYQHLISSLVLVWPSRAEKSNASCMPTIFCSCHLMKKGYTKAFQL